MFDYNREESEIEEKMKEKKEEERRWFDLIYLF